MSVDHGDHTHPGMDTEELGYFAKRVRAIEAVLEEKGVLTTAEVQANVDAVESRSPTDGARVVARAWADPAFKERLLSEPGAALNELGYQLPDPTPKLGVFENTGEVHHLVVCTLCSCYPGRCWAGLPTGTKASPTGPGRWSTPAGSCGSSVLRSATTPRCGCWTAPPTCDTWCCPSVLPAPRG